MNKPHIKAEFIKAKADGFIIQENLPGTLNWIDMPVNDWHFEPDYNYRIKPEREYPVTSLRKCELSEIYSDGGNYLAVNEHALELVANAAIKQHIIDTEGK